MKGDKFPVPRNKFPLTENKFPVTGNIFPVTRNILSFIVKMSCTETGNKFPVTKNKFPLKENKLPVTGNKFPVTTMIFRVRENSFLMNFWLSFRCITFSRQMCGIYNQNFV